MPNRHDLIRNASLRDISLMDHRAPARAGAHRPRQIYGQTSARIHSATCGLARSIRRPGGCRLVEQTTFLLRDRRRRRQRVPPVKPHRGGIHDYCALRYSKRFYKLRPARGWSQHRTAGNRCIAAVAESHAGAVASPVTGPLSLWSGSAAPRRRPAATPALGRIYASDGGSALTGGDQHWDWECRRRRSSVGAGSGG
jgi:hypothetical protein